METAVYLGDTDELKDAALFAFFYEKMSGSDRKKIDFYRQDSDRRLALGARVLLQEALRREGFGPFETAEEPDGKPYFPERPDIRFSLSHSGHCAMCVLSEQTAGCDDEEYRDAPEAVAKRFFSKEEQDYVFSRHGKDRKNRAFFRIWTLKESYLKALGTGLRTPLDSFSVIPQGRKIFSSGTGPCAFFEYRQVSGYAASVCLLQDPDIRPAGLSEDTAVHRPVCFPVSFRELKDRYARMEEKKGERS